MRDWDNDAREDSAAYLADLDRQERYAADRFEREHGSYASCQHDYRPDRRGGGTCRYCGDTLDGDEL